MLSIKITRLKKGLSQKELCNLSGLSICTLSNMEQIGVNPRIDNLVKIADALKITLDELVQIDDKNS